MLYVYHRPANVARASALADALRAEGHRVRVGDVRYVTEPERDATTVYIDRMPSGFAAACLSLGLPILPLSADHTVAQEPEAHQGTGDYRVEQRGSWYTLLDPTGQKVGSAKRTEGEAWDQVNDHVA